MSSSLRTAVEDLRAALVDEDAGNGQVRDCAFEVVETWDADAERASTLETARRLTRLLSDMSEAMALTCRHTNVLRDAGPGWGSSIRCWSLASQVLRFVSPENVAEYRRRLHADEIHLQDYGMPDGNARMRRRRGGDHESPRDQAGAHHLPRVPDGAPRSCLLNCQGAEAMSRAGGPVAHQAGPRGPVALRLPRRRPGHRQLPEPLRAAQPALRTAAHRAGLSHPGACLRRRAASRDLRRPPERRRRVSRRGELVVRRYVVEWRAGGPLAAHRPHLVDPLRRRPRRASRVMRNVICDGTRLLRPEAPWRRLGAPAVPKWCLGHPGAGAPSERLSRTVTVYE